MSEDLDALLGKGVTKEETESFAYGVLTEEGFQGWVIEWSSDGECINDLRIILLPEGYLLPQLMWTAFEYVLHEIAHIRTFKGLCKNGGHNQEFYAEYARLINKYLGDSHL